LLNVSNRSAQLRRRMQAIVAAVLTASGLICYQAVRTMTRTSGWVVHTEEVLAQLELAMSDLKDAEVGQRGYLLTSDVSYLEPYDAAVHRINQDVEHLARLTSDNPRQRQAVAAVRPVVAERLSVLEQTIDLMRSGHGPAALETLRSGRGKTLMDDARRRFDAMRAEEQRLLGVRIGDARRATVATFAAVLMSAALAVGMLVVFTQSAGRYASSLEHLAADLETRVAERTYELGEANAELQAFANSIAHDLRAPLRNIQGFGAALLEDYGETLEPEGRGYAERIVTGTERLDTLIHDLLAYARVTRADVRLEPVRIDGVVERALEDLGPELTQRRASVRCDIPAAAVRAHPPTLLQVVENLVSNAAKFVAPGVRPEIAIRAAASGPRVRVSVTDNGIGIAAVDADAIFRMFERLHPQERYGGTGIGLAIVKRAIERMDGAVGVESVPGGGSTFWFELQSAADAAI
jgi:signal transduction histidine kinase